MTARVTGREYHISKNRLESLVDGIFAIAMTLLVLGIELPKPQESIDMAALPAMINGLIPQIILFIIAFVVLALFWHGHPRQFHFVHLVDPALLWINILILIPIVFVPFSTDIAGDFPAALIAALLFHVTMFIVGLLFAVSSGATSPGMNIFVKRFRTRRSSVTGFSGPHGFLPLLSSQWSLPW